MKSNDQILADIYIPISWDTEQAALTMLHWTSYYAGAMQVSKSREYPGDYSLAQWVIRLTNVGIPAL